MALKDNWTVKQTSKLISCYKKYPNLWDCSNNYYKNMTLRKYFLSRLSQELKDTKPDTTINDIRTKLKTLRSQFRKEKIRREQILSRNSKDPYEPKLWCYDDLKFIDVNECSQKNPTEANNIDYQISDESIEELSEDKCLDEMYTDKIEKRGRPSRYPPWTKEQTCTLLSLFKQHPLLYDSTHPRYAQTIHRNRALREMHGTLKIYRPSVTMPEIRAKLKTLRSQYIKEKRKAVNKRYIPKLWFFEQMQFIDDRGKFLEEEREQRLSALNQENEMREQPDDCYVVENENEIFVKSFDESDSEESTTPFPLRDCEQKSSVLYRKCLSLVETLSTQMEDNRIIDPIKGKTPAALLGRMVETELSNFPEDIYDDAKWKIINVLEEASKKNKLVNLNRF